MVVVFISGSITQTPPHSYWFLFKEANRTWCGYGDEKVFQELADQLKPVESARVVYTNGDAREITYQVQAESGDWVVIDKYSFLLQRATLRRATVFAQSGIQVIQEGSIVKGGRHHLSLVSAEYPNGTKASINNLDFPAVAIVDGPSQFPFMTLADSMTKTSLRMLCSRPDR